MRESKTGVRSSVTRTPPSSATLAEPAAERGPIVLADLFLMAEDASLVWEAFRPGVEIHRLYATPDGRSAALLRYAPGAALPRHYHVGWEHIFILSGSQRDDNGLHQRGTLLVHPPGTSHAVRSDDGCVAMAVWEKPVVFEPPAS